jgi:hypothetical protein
MANMMSDWKGNANDRGRFSVFFGPNFIFWSGRKQPTICRSNIEPEYKTLADVTAEII